MCNSCNSGFGSCGQNFNAAPIGNGCGCNGNNGGGNGCCRNDPLLAGLKNLFAPFPCRCGCNRGCNNGGNNGGNNGCGCNGNAAVPFFGTVAVSGNAIFRNGGNGCGCNPCNQCNGGNYDAYYVRQYALCGNGCLCG